MAACAARGCPRRKLTGGAAVRPIPPTTLDTRMQLDVWAVAERRIGLALYAQFGPGKFPANWWTIFWCIVTYIVLALGMNYYSWRMERDAFLVTRPFRVGLRGWGSCLNGPPVYLQLQLPATTGLGMSFDWGLPMTYSSLAKPHADPTPLRSCVKRRMVMIGHSLPASPPLSPARPHNHDRAARGYGLPQPWAATPRATPSCSRTSRTQACQ